MCCCETVIDGQGAVFTCDREQDHDGDHQDGKAARREDTCGEASVFITVTWPKVPCLAHPTGPHADQSFIDSMNVKEKP